MSLFRRARVRRPHANAQSALLLVAAAYAAGCEAGKAAPSEAEPAETEVDTRPALVAELRERPADFPADSVRATLAWVDGRPLDAPETSSPDDLRELRFQQTSDVAVEVRFPLTVRVPIDPVEPMHYTWLAGFGVPPGVSDLGEFQDDRHVNSLPQAELVVYLDANHNQKLDLLEPGEPGPSPDRVLALASGRDAEGQALRNVVVNKQSPFEPPLELFVPDWGRMKNSDGLFVVHVSVPPEMPLAQDALLSTHGITMSNTFDKYWARNMAQRDFVYSVEALDSMQPIPLFPVTAAQKSWLARACVPYPTGFLGYAKSPPPGAAVWCGADRLSYASHPEDYCGQSDTLTRIDWQGDPDLSWWPCDERGLSPEAPYVPAKQPFGTSVLSMHNSKAYIGIPFYEPPTDFHCRADVIYDFDDDPKTHLPAIAPPPGSQVMCYGHSALSFVPDDPDCKRKFSYELSSDDIPGYTGDGVQRWDLRDKPPPWWPCNDQGKLIAGSEYKAPAKLPDSDACSDAPAFAAPSGDYPPPPHSKIRCTSAISLVSVPAWADHCDGRTETTLEGKPQTTPIKTAGWELPAPDGWPCDKDGKFVPARGYEPL